MRIITSPLDSWGPALLEHRKEAARVHAQHGTTMGGVVDLDHASDINRNPANKYDALSKDEMEEPV